MGGFGIINLLMIIFIPTRSALALNLGTTFLIGALSLIYAVVIWGHARTPAVALSSRR
jgi:hypothetical protein